jgi:hypothetical protein
MKIKFLKDHGPHKKHDVADYADAGGTYLVQVGAAKLHDDNEPAKKAAPKKAAKKAAKKKA